MIPEDVLTFFDCQQGRRPKAILNVLTGKMTVSALFLGLNYDILEYLNFWKAIDASEFLNTVNQAVDEGLLIREDAQVYLTEVGLQKKQVLAKLPAITKSIRLDEAINLILLANQVISELSFGNKRYTPVSDNIRINVVIKQWFKQLKLQSKSAAEMVHYYVAVLSQLASELKQEDADLLLSYLPNHVDPGLTNEQLAQLFGISKFQMAFKIRVVFSEFINRIIELKLQPFGGLLKDTIKNSVMPESTFQTWQLICQGKSVTEVAHLRRVKINTVKEHILMAAILDSNFPFDMFIKYDLDLGMNPADIRFNSIQKQFTDITFFDFRLIQIKKIKDLKNSNDNGQ